jgi:hypothetical protein
VNLSEESNQNKIGKEGEDEGNKSRKEKTRRKEQDLFPPQSCGEAGDFTQRE